MIEYFVSLDYFIKYVHFMHKNRAELINRNTDCYSRYEIHHNLYIFRVHLERE